MGLIMSIIRPENTSRFSDDRHGLLLKMIEVYKGLQDKLLRDLIRTIHHFMIKIFQYQIVHDALKHQWEINVYSWANRLVKPRNASNLMNILMIYTDQIVYLRKIMHIPECIYNSSIRHALPPLDTPEGYPLMYKINFK
jgi:hypothetical protein